MWVSLVENNEFEAEGADFFIQKNIKSLLDQDEQIDTIILGCTHYPFIKKQLLQFLGEDIPILDGSIGTVKNLRRQLVRLGILNPKVEQGKVEMLNSLDGAEVISLSYKLFNL